MIEQMNRLIHYLAESDITTQKLLGNKFDLIILAGNSLPHLAQYCGELLDKKVAPRLLISGGNGHGTVKLLENIQRFSVLKEEEYTKSDSEAKLLGKIVEKHHRTSFGEIFLEEESRNTGENARFSFEIVETMKHKPQKILLLQDPILLRRTKLTFQQAFPADEYEFFRFTPFIPYLEKQNKFKDDQLDGLWEEEYFISLVIGEIKRLYDTEEGYGPQGAGFLPHIDLPEEVINDYQHLRTRLHSLR